MMLEGSNSPCGRGHDAASPVHRHPAATPPLWRVVVHPKVVPQLVGQGHGGTQRVLRVVLGEPGTQILDYHVGGYTIHLVQLVCHLLQWSCCLC